MSNEFDPLKVIRDLFQIKTENKAPTIPATVKLLNWLEGLDHAQRCKRMIEIGRESKSADSAVAAHSNKILDELQTGHFYERMLALMSCQGSGDSRRILLYTKDRSRYLRRLARNMAVQYCSDEEILPVLSALKGDECRSLLKRLHKHGRQAIIDKFIESIKESRRKEFRSLCFFASTDLIKSYLPIISDTLSAQETARFSYQAPELCAEFLEQCASNSQRGDARLLNLFRGASKWLSELKPDHTVRLIAKLLELYSANQLVCNVLIKRPAEITELFSKQQNLGAADLSDILHKLPESLLLQTLKENPSLANSIGSRLKRLAPNARKKVFEQCKENWRNSDGLIPPYFIEPLPSTARISEAKRNLAVPVIASRLANKLEYVRLLDWNEVKLETSESINSPETEDRSLGLYALCYASKFHRDKLAEVLDLLHKHKNEPEPVRLAFLAALSTLPPAAFKADTLPALNLVVEDALNAFDLSSTSLQYIGRLYLRLYNKFPDFVGERIANMLESRGSYFFVSNPCWLNDEETKSLSRFLAKPVDYWILKEQTTDLQNLARWLDRRLPHCQPANEGLFYLCKQEKNQSISEKAARLLHDNNRPVFEKFVLELLKLDESWGGQSSIYEYLSRKRQSMLTPYLGQNALTGRFASGKIRLVPDFTAGFHRWSSKQQTIYSLALSRLIQNNSSNHSDKLFGIYRLCRLPQPDTTVLGKLVAADNEENAVRDFAIRQLASTDDDCGTPILLSCLNDERARQAIYALRTAILNMETDAALNLLKSVPREKITIFKEIVRIAGDTKSEKAFEWLLELEAGELHRDVRLALLRALWNFPEKGQTWTILRKTVSTGDSVFAETASRFPASNLSSNERRHLLEVYGDALQIKDSSTRISALQTVSMAAITDSEHYLLPQLKTCLSSENQDEFIDASWAIIALYAGKDPEVLSDCLKVIIDKPRNLHSYIDQLRAHFSRHNEPYLQDTLLLCKSMKPDPKTIELQLSLAGTVLSWKEFGQMIVELEQANQLHFDAMQTASKYLSQTARASQTSELEELELELKSKKAENLRRLALAALIGIANSSGWTDERLARLKEFRLDPSLLVSSAALFTLPAKEFARA